MTPSDRWKFHRGIVDTPKQKPKSYSLVYRNGVVAIAERPYGYVLKVKNTQHPNAVITPNF